MKKRKGNGLETICLAVFLLVVLIIPAQAVIVSEDGKSVIPDRLGAAEKIVVDADLSESTWQLPAIAETFKTAFFTYGEPFEHRTDVWMAYDRENLYFAFKCYDSEPDKIKTSVTQRDNIAREDFVGILLDALGNKQTGYEFYINPNGIQWDAVSSAVSGSDQSPDFVWESAGKLTPEGYNIEVRIPLESIRYQGGKEVKMGVIFIRQISRLGILGSWPEMKPGKTDFNFMADVIYHDLKGALKLEVLPNITYSLDSQRDTPGSWSKESDVEAGIGLKYGITSAMTLEATVNPDFSQVESDVFQVEVNRRYPVFFSEKRPFFMESKEVMDFTIIQNGLMIAPIHTRNIIDPAWAAKFSGSAGRLNFAFLAADDQAPGWDSGGGESTYFGIVRAKYSLGSDNSLGILYSGRYFAGQSNHAGGIDLKYQLSKALRASLSYLSTATQAGDDAQRESGGGINAMLQYSKRTFLFTAAYERYDPGFYMATAFQNRVGISRYWAQVGPRFELNVEKTKFMNRIVPYIGYSRLHDLGTNMDDTLRAVGVTFGFVPLGEVTIEYRDEDESWAGEELGKRYVTSFGHLQLFKWLHLTGSFTVGDQVYYHPTEPFVGAGRTFNIGFTLNAGVKLRIGLDYTYSGLKNKIDHGQVYSLDIYNLHTTYQFNKYFFLRGIVRYDSFQDKMLTDCLASFTLIPGTVVHLGYGSLHLQNEWQDGVWIPGRGDLLKMKQGLFFKASYLWRIK